MKWSMHPLRTVLVLAVTAMSFDSGSVPTQAFDQVFQP